MYMGYIITEKTHSNSLISKFKGVGILRRKYLQGTRYINVDQESFELHYFLVVEEVRDYQIFGVEIVKTLQMGDKQLQSESEFVPGISDSQEVVEEIINRLIAGIVTPVALVEILDQMVSMEAISS